MKAISLTQPWATLIAIGAKRIETRSWNTAYRGRLAIHASKNFPRKCEMLTFEFPFKQVLRDAGISAAMTLPTSAIVAVVNLVSTVRFDDSENWPEPERSFGDFAAGRYGFVLADIIKLPDPIACRGALGIWDTRAVAPDLESQIEAAIAAGASS